MMQHPRTDTIRISQFDDQIRVEAKKIGWDWRLLASIIYQESRFKPNLVNGKGAFGLMQLMPVVMSHYGIDQNASVEEQLEVGGKLLMYLDHRLAKSIPDKMERRYFVLASYNAGLGKVMNSRELAQKNGFDPNVWFGNVERYSPRQTVVFVKEVTARYSDYRDLVE